MKSYVHYALLFIAALALAACSPADKPIQEVSLKEATIESVVLGGVPAPKDGVVAIAAPTTCSFRLLYGRQILSYYIDEVTAVGRYQHFQKCVTLRRGDVLTVEKTTWRGKDDQYGNPSFRWRAGDISDNLMQ